MAKFAYNNTKNISIGQRPFELNCSYYPSIFFKKNICKTIALVVEQKLCKTIALVVKQELLDVQRRLLNMNKISYLIRHVLTL